MPQAPAPDPWRIAAWSFAVLGVFAWILSAAIGQAPCRLLDCIGRAAGSVLFLGIGILFFLAAAVLALIGSSKRRRAAKAGSTPK